MRGSPIIRALCAFIALLALAPLLAHVTSTPPRKVVASTVAPLRKVELALTFTTLPKRITILHLGCEVFATGEPAAAEEVSLDIPWPEQGGELVFRVEWPADAPLAAMRARLTDPNDVEIERSLWGTGQTEAVLNFP